ncbi:hypothetical protein B0H17DRAFT_1144854 [Mycena rosella]|uniref:Uncharacterized protein n=1 Tax=Mycena rosella TaxID=1033263 RepID=A0AAD7G687_MYCRO|nr:hypothetical protein B0H17DRAFT_1144854 [Mycena rosella]
MPMDLLFVINVVFIADNELSLQKNRRLQAAGESAWTFRQILVILLLVLPLRDLVETMSERRETKHKKDIAHHEKEHSNLLDEALRRAIREQGTMESIGEVKAVRADRFLFDSEIDSDVDSGSRIERESTLIQNRSESSIYGPQQENYTIDTAYPQKDADSKVLTMSRTRRWRDERRGIKTLSWELNRAQNRAQKRGGQSCDYATVLQLASSRLDERSTHSPGI